MRYSDARRMMRKMMVMKMKSCPPVLLALLVMAQNVSASEFRFIRPILRPVAPVTSAASGTGAASVARSGGAALSGKVQATPRRQMKPISRRLAARAVNKFVAAWNENNLNSVLADNFFDKSRLNDAMNTKVPRDAELTVLAIQGIQTLSQHEADSPSGRLLVSTVSITVRTQLTFNDPQNGYQRREGVNEYIMEIKQLVSS